MIPPSDPTDKLKWSLRKYFKNAKRNSKKKQRNIKQSVQTEQIIIILNIYGLNTAIKRHRFSDGVGGKKTYVL